MVQQSSFSLLTFIFVLQGYLSCNRFGTFLGLAHAAITAEGDNSVLMQKVAKERLGAMQKERGSERKGAQEDLSRPDYLLQVLSQREWRLFERLGGKMAKAGKEGLFRTWMEEESDLVQGASRAFADRLIAERCLCCSFD